MMKREKIVNEIRNKLKEIAPVALSILYGSEARGEAGLDELFLIELKNEVLISPLILLQQMWEERTTLFTYNVLKDGIRL